jgi:serine protease Do
MVHPKPSHDGRDGGRPRVILFPAGITQKEHRMRHAFLLLLLFVLPTVTRAAEYVEVPPPSWGTKGYADIVDQVLPAVVSLSVIKVTSVQSSQEGMTARRQRFFGSGFVIDPRGIIVTNRHVIQGAVEITAVFADNSHTEARLVGVSNVADLAVLTVNVGHPLPALVFANSADARIGNEVMAIGNPYGLGTSVSAGIISGLNRDLSQSPFDDDIQTDAVINPGNSGGPLINVRGEVIGVDTALYSQAGEGYIGIGYAIPANDASLIVRHLLNPNLPAPGWIGVTAQDVTEELATGFGVPQPGGALVISVVEGGPASLVGLRPGDVVLDINGNPVTDARAMIRTIALMDVGHVVKLTIWRDHRQHKLTVALAGWPDFEVPPEAALASSKLVAMVPSPDQGLKLAVLTDATRQKLGIPLSISGVLVEHVAEDTEADLRGLQPGNVIVIVDGSPVSTPDAVETKIRKAQSDRLEYLPMLVFAKDRLRWSSYYTEIK